MFNNNEQLILMNKVSKMNNRLIEKEILEKAIDALKAATNAEIEWDILEWELPPEPPLSRPDARLTIKLAEKELQYVAEVRATITPAVLGIIVNQLRAQRLKWLLVARHIPTQFAKTLIEMEIPFIDTAGNAYINEPPIYIRIQGRRVEGMEWARLAEKGIMRQAGLRAVFALLCNKDLINATFREIAVTAGTALGTIDLVIKDLKKRGFLLDMGERGRKLTRKRELIDWWVDAYAEKLRPKQIIGRYETDDYEQLQNADFKKLNAQWGGEMAAGIMTNYLRAEIYTIYANRPINDLIRELKLRNRRTGKIEIRERFWYFEDKLQKRGLVHPILVYADLLATGDPRNIETAKIIYDALIGMEN